MYQPTIRDFTTDSIHRRLFSAHPAYSFGYWQIESLLWNRPAEYKQNDIYEGKFAEIKNYEQEYEQDTPIIFKTHIPMEHQPLYDIPEPSPKEYDPEIEKIMIQHALDEWISSRQENLDDSSVDDSELTESVIPELLRIIHFDEGNMSETNIDNQNSEIELDDVLENDDIREDITLDVIIDEILGEQIPDYSQEEEQLEEQVEAFVPFY